jgi:hypothetical protein
MQVFNCPHETVNFSVIQYDIPLIHAYCGCPGLFLLFEMHFITVFVHFSSSIRLTYPYKIGLFNLYIFY